MNLPFFSKQKPIRMLWRIEKEGRFSHLVGTAHFFPYSFRSSLKRLIQAVETVMFEGPLDEESSARIAAHSRDGEHMPAFVDGLTQESIKAIDRLLRKRLGDQGSDTWLLLWADHEPDYFEAFTRGIRPYASFFSIWKTCLGWDYSVDMEAYRVASDLGKEIHFLETIDEQLEVLDNIPLERITRMLNDVENWDDYNQAYVQYYLNGDLEKLLTLTSRFATRGPNVIGNRDRIQFERMKPVFEKTNVLAFIGFPHVPGVANLFREEGYTVKQVSY